MTKTAVAPTLDDANRVVPFHGSAGRLAGMERAAIRNLELDGRERVLDIGFGRGFGIRRLVRSVGWVRVAGIDPSEGAVRRLTKRFHRTRKHVDLRIGNASHLPWHGHSFDAVMSVDVTAWDRLDAGMAEVRRVLKPDGKISIAVRAGDHDLAGEVTDALWLAGFSAVRRRRSRVVSVRTLYITARAM